MKTGTIRRCLVLGSWCLLAASAASAQTVAITGGRVFPVSSAPIDNATVLIVDGKISAVGANVAVPAGATRIDAKGKWVTPGLINAATELGVVEVDAVADTNDETAKGQDAVASAFRVWDGLNPATVLWAPARNEGITSALVLPTGGLIAGQAALVDLADGSKTDVVRKAPAAMAAQLDSSQAANTRAKGELVMRLRELLDDARVYAAKRDSYESGSTRTFSAGRLHLEALVPVVEGRLPLLLGVNRAADIETALDLATEYKVKLMILGGAEAWEVAPRLASAKVPVLTTAMNNIPGGFEQLGARQENAALLRKAGVAVVIIDSTSSFYVRNIRQSAGNAVAYGLSWDEALRAVTMTPAEVFGAADTIGSLQPGMVANVVVWSGDPFEFATRAEHVYVRGKDVKGPSRQDMLTDRYKKK